MIADKKSWEKWAEAASVGEQAFQYFQLSLAIVSVLNICHFVATEFSKEMTCHLVLR
jgi:hypothetical protein